jgi:hypothetical protein
MYDMGQFSAVQSMHADQKQPVGVAERKYPLQEKSPIGRLASLLCLCLQYEGAGMMGVWIIM